MALSTLVAPCVVGIGTIPIRVEALVGPGLYQFTIIGLPDRQLEEARERVRSAIRSSKLPFPKGRITVSLSPANLPKRGTGFDLAIALALLQAQGALPAASRETWVLGELGLDGSVRTHPHALPILVEARRRQVPCLIPEECREEAQAVGGCPVCLVGNLAEAAQQVAGKAFRPLPVLDRPTTQEEPESLLIDQIVGQPAAKRALEIALAGGHNLLLTGQPGVGKSMLAAAAAELLPPLSDDERVEVACLRSMAGEPMRVGSTSAPFRAPHHSVSRSKLFGSAVTGRPGELSLAQHGILFLDEFPLLAAEVREALRQPLQDRFVWLAHPGGPLRLPAAAIVIATQNGCPCGLLGSEEGGCRCTPVAVHRYRQLLSEPLLERFSVFCELRRVGAATWQGAGGQNTQSGKDLGRRIAKAREAQRRRNSGALNGHITSSQVRRLCILDDTTSDYQRSLASRLYVSARSLQSIQAVARTIADLEEKSQIELGHMQEAAMYRRRVGD